jgi:large subunit ribosomal protein L1
MSFKGKRHKEALAKIDRTKRYPFAEGLTLALGAAYAKFDETVDMAVRLGVDPRHADQMVRGTCVLPNGIGKDVRVLVFAKGEKEKEAADAGADYVGSDELIEKIKGGWLDFDKTVATPDMMGSVGKLGKILGPRGMMPNAKLGTVTFDLTTVVKELKAGKIDFRVEKNGIVHAPMGKVSFGPDKLLQNMAAFFEVVQRLKPTTSKGTYFKGISISTTMGPGVKIDPGQIRELITS